MGEGVHSECACRSAPGRGPLRVTLAHARGDSDPRPTADRAVDAG
jgi:hypothetical protein